MVSTVNREKAQKLKGAESEISLTPIALVAGETVVCPRFTDLPRFTHYRLKEGENNIGLLLLFSPANIYLSKIFSIEVDIVSIGCVMNIYRRLAVIMIACD